MSCTIVVKPHEQKETALKRWEKIYSLLAEEKEMTRKQASLRSYQGETKARLKNEIKDFRKDESGILKVASKKLYKPTDRFLAYLSGEWEMAFETYQVLEFIFRATIESYERNLFDYGGIEYGKALSRVKGPPDEKYDEILKLVGDFAPEHFFGLEDLRPTKMDYINDLNAELRQHVAQIQELQKKLSFENQESPIVKDLEKAIKGLEGWAMGKVLGPEKNLKFLSFDNGQVVMNPKGFLYFKVYIVAFMGTYGKFIKKMSRELFPKIGQLAERKIKFESKEHLGFEIDADFLGDRERFANDFRTIETLPYDKGFLDDELLDLIIEENGLLIESGELPFHLVNGYKGRRTA